jgi:sugar O-acyltransferase (sialic acid O-acetyltransferase NeuD family)
MKTLIFGAGQVAETIAEVLGKDFLRFVVDDEYAVQGALKLSQLSTYKAMESYGVGFVVGMSFKGLNQIRAKKFTQLLQKYKPSTVIAPSALVSPRCEIRQGCVIMERNLVQPFVTIGQNTILWSSNHIGHHAKIGDHVWLSSGIVVSGACEIGDYTFIGSGVTIIDGVKIGKRCIIGAGATITRDCEDDGVYPGPYAVRSKVPSHKLKGVWAQ